MEDFDVVTEFRARWCCILEDELECPICLEIDESTEIIQCINSHNVCSNCRVKLSVCPSCKGEFLTTRNKTVESLIKKFVELKSSLMDPENDKNQRINLNKKSVSCQTDSENKIVTQSVKCQTETKIQKSIDTQTIEVDSFKNETNQSSIPSDSHNGDKKIINNVVPSIIPKLELVAEEMKPPLRRSTRIKKKISRYCINHH